MNTSFQQLRRSSESPDSICGEIGGFSLDVRKGKIYKAMVSCCASSQMGRQKPYCIFSDTFGIQMDRQFVPEGLHGWCQAQLLCHLLGVNNPFAFCVPGRLLLKGSGQVYPCPCPGSWHQLCCAALVDGAVNGSYPRCQESHRRRWESITVLWQGMGHRTPPDPRSAQLFFCSGAFLPFAPGRLVTGAGNTSAIGVLSSWPASAQLAKRVRTAFRMLTGQAPLCRAFRGALGNKMMQGGDERAGTSPLPSPWRQAMQQLRCKWGHWVAETVAVSPCCWVEHGKSNEFPAQLSAAGSKHTHPSCSPAFLAHYHLLTSTPVWYYIFSLERVSFLSPFPPSVDTIPCVCPGETQLAHAGGEHVDTPESADSGRGAGGPHPDSAAEPPLAACAQCQAHSVHSQPRSEPRLPSPPALPGPRRACCQQGTMAEPSARHKDNSCTPGSAFAASRTMAVCNPIPLPAPE